MKKYGGLLAFGVAVVFGLLAVVLANNWLSSRTSEANTIVKDTIALTQVVVAVKDISIGTPLTKENLSLADWPKANLPKGAFHDIALLENRIAVTQLAAGQPILAVELAAPGSGAGLVALIPPGRRAMAVRVDEVTGVGGFVLPNTSVDIIGIETHNKGNKTSKTILKNIKVLAIAQETFTEDGKAKIVRTVTLELDPKQAETLALQVNKGEIHLALRTPLENNEEPPVAAVKVAKTVKKAAPRVYYAPKPDTYTVEVIRGSAKPEQIKFKNINSDEKL